MRISTAIVIGIVIGMLLTIFIALNTDRSYVKRKILEQYADQAHLYGSTTIDTTCWNKNDQLHYILKDTRLELKDCNYENQLLLDSITALHRNYGFWLEEMEQHIDEDIFKTPDGYNIDDNGIRMSNTRRSRISSVRF